MSGPTWRAFSATGRCANLPLTRNARRIYGGDETLAKKRKTLNTRPKGKGKAGGKWAHGFKPKNAVARKLKNKTYGRKGMKPRTRGRKRR